MSANRVIFDHYSQFPMEEWRWPNFTPAELACNGTGKLMVDFDAMDRLQALRDDLGQPIHLNSAYRSPEYNAKVGGAKASQHMEAKAFDPSMINHDPHKFEAAAIRAGFTAIGYYVSQNFMHIDCRARPEGHKPAKWGKPWPKPEIADDPHKVLANRPKPDAEPAPEIIGNPLSRPRRRRLGFAPRF